MIAPNQSYYLATGPGSWEGEFSFRITSWPNFWNASLGISWRLLAIGMVVVQWLTGNCRISSTVRGFASWGVSGVATNDVRIRKFGLTLYRLREQYVLHPDGAGVTVHSRDRYGPIPGLIRTRSRHPAIVSEAGARAVYERIPLLGTFWVGRYTVNDKGDGLDAELVCDWASAGERISRKTRYAVEAPRDLGRMGAGPNRIEPRNLDSVIATLGRYRAWYDGVRDRRAVFTHAYLLITTRFRDELHSAGFEDPDWIVALDVSFAEEYLRACETYDLGRDPAGAWGHVFQAMTASRTSVLEDLILSMAAHIIQDLPLALEKSGVSTGGRTRVPDFTRANDVLERGIDEIQGGVADRYGGILRYFDRMAGRQDEIVTNYGIRLARAAAWFNAQRLVTDRTRSTALASLGKSVSVLVDQVLRPPLFSLAILFRVVRSIARLSRRWPDADAIGGSAKVD